MYKSTCSASMQWVNSLQIKGEIFRMNKKNEKRGKGLQSVYIASLIVDVLQVLPSDDLISRAFGCDEALHPDLYVHLADQQQPHVKDT